MKKKVRGGGEAVLWRRKQLCAGEVGQWLKELPKFEIPIARRNMRESRLGEMLSN